MEYLFSREGRYFELYQVLAVNIVVMNQFQYCIGGIVMQAMHELAVKNSGSLKLKSPFLSIFLTFG